MNVSRLITVSLALIITAFGATNAAQGSNLLLNGSFERPMTAADWIATGNEGEISNQGVSDGSLALAFSLGNAPSNGVISQTFATSLNARYSLTFDFGKFSVRQPHQVARLNVDVFNGAGFTGAHLLQQTVADATPGVGDPDNVYNPNPAAVYSRFTFSFVAGGSSATLRFSDVSDPQVSGGGFDAMLDNVQVQQVPEPATIALAIIGGALLVAVRRMRRH